MRNHLIPLGLAVILLAGCTPIDTAEPTVPTQDADSPAAKTSAAKKKTTPIRLQARRATATRSILSDGGALSCVRVTVTNHTRKSLAVNPLYFSLTDTHGTKHEVGDALADYEGQIDTTTLAPGENAKGLVCVKGKFAPAVVAFTNELLSEVARAKVS